MPAEIGHGETRYNCRDQGSRRATPGLAAATSAAAAGSFRLAEADDMDLREDVYPREAAPCSPRLGL